MKIRNQPTSLKIMKNMNIIIYGSVRNIENHFIKTFMNIDLLCDFFNKTHIVIMENDSDDNTRYLLNKWFTTKTPDNITKHIILKDNLDKLYPLRAHRIAYCRNEILHYIFDNHLDDNYTYAIHCDLDDRFWSLDFYSMTSCFQYNLNDWDAMFPINQYNINTIYYYDFWALRCKQTWFDDNIFSCRKCNNNYMEYENKVDGLIDFFKQNMNELIQVESAFNTMGIYKLKSMKNCYYNATYSCEICNNKCRGCIEDNDHIGLHKTMINNNCKLFINTEMKIEYSNNSYDLYRDFIENIELSPKLFKEPLKYVLYNKMVDKTGLWIILSNYLNEYENNMISNFTTNDIYSFTYNSNTNINFINKNVKHLDCNRVFNLNSNILLNNTNNDITFIYMNLDNYHLSKKIFEKIYTKIKKGCIIIFNNFTNYNNNYNTNDVHIFYEFVQKYNIYFDYIGRNGKNNDCQMVIKIVNNPYNNNSEDVYIYKNHINFDWKLYIHNNNISNIKTKEEAWNHWKIYKQNENKVYYLQKYNNFDWEKYIKFNSDLTNIKTKEEAWNHWQINGKYENRIFYNNDYSFNHFDWEKYIKFNSDLTNIKTKEEAWNHWQINGKYENRFFYNNDYSFNHFDWEKYIKYYADLFHFKTKEEAWNHWQINGIYENRIFFINKI
jgi:hypothetical protein